MSVKSDVSAAYTIAQLAEHGRKPVRLPPWIMITGDQKVNSIGEAIYQYLYPKEKTAAIKSYIGDVRETSDHLDMELFDTLIMCHGVSHLDWFEDVPIEKVKEIFDVNLFGTFNITQAFVRATMKAPYRKRIIMIGSMAHRAVLNGSAAYCASKAGVAHLARCMAWELAPKGYDVYCIHPSNTLDTPMSKETIEGLMRYRNMTQTEAESYWNDSQVRTESLTKDEIARLVDHIIYCNFGYLSGSQLELAGGQR